MFADSSFVTFITAINFIARVLFSIILIYAETAVPNKIDFITYIGTLSWHEITTALFVFLFLVYKKWEKGKILMIAIGKQTLNG